MKFIKFLAIFLSFQCLSLACKPKHPKGRAKKMSINLKDYPRYHNELNANAYSSAVSSNSPLQTCWNLGIRDSEKSLQLSINSGGDLSLTNSSKQCVDAFVLGDGKTQYYVGNFDFNGLIQSITQNQSLSELQKASKIWYWTQKNFTHRCSNGSTLTPSIDASLTLWKIYSSSFGCCSDINWPIMADLFAHAGLQVYVLKAKRHTSTQLKLGDGSYYYADADLSSFVQGSVQTTAPAFFQGIFNLREMVGGAYPTVTYGSGGIYPMLLQLAPGDSLVYANRSVDTQGLVSNPYENVTGTDLTQLSALQGTAHLDLGNMLTKNTASAQGKHCNDYLVQLPYIMNAFAFDSLPNDAVLFLGPGLTQVPITRNGDSSVPLNVPASFSSLRPSDSPLSSQSVWNYAWGRFAVQARVCSSSLAANPIKATIGFQYNGLLFPQNRSEITVKSKDSVVVDQVPFSTDQAQYTLSGQCPIGMQSVFIKETGASAACSGGDWSSVVNLQVGVNTFTVFANRAYTGTSASVAVTRVASVQNLTITSPKQDASGNYVVSGQEVYVEGACFDNVRFFTGSDFYTAPCENGVWSVDFPMTGATQSATIMSLNNVGFPFQEQVQFVSLPQ